MSNLEGSNMQTVQREGLRMRTAGAGCVSLFLLAALCNATEQARPTAANQPWNHSLKILYAGRPGSDREKDFVGFLKKYFDVVQTGNLQTFKETDTQGFDVTLLDWDWNDLRGPNPAVSPSFSRPVVTLGVPGGMICRQWRLKPGYL
jgi:hypothetical protein